MKDKKEVKTNRPRTYDESFKRMVISEYRSGRWSMEQLRRRYGLAGKSCISEWMVQLDDRQQKPRTEIWAQNENTVSKLKKKERVEDLRKQIKDLERQLEDEQLRSDAYSRLIDLAENEHRIAIRKKGNTK